MNDDNLTLEGEFSALPEFEESGSMPPGVHDCSLHGLADLTAFNEHRKKMWRQLASFLSVPMFNHDFVHAYIGGDFLSTKEEPSTIDILLETSEAYGPDSLAAVCPYFMAGIDRVEALFGINLHFKMQGAPNAQFDGPFSTSPSTFFDDPEIQSQPGLARLSLNAADSLLNLKELIRAN